MVASVGHGVTAGHYRGSPAWAMLWQPDTTERRQRGQWDDCRTLQRGASMGHGMTAGKYGRTAGKRGTSGYEPAGKNTPIATGLKAA